MCAASRDNDVKPDHLTAGGHLGRRRRRDSLPRTAVELESEERRCLELSLSVRANGATNKLLMRRAAGETEEAESCDVGWRSRKMEEEEEEGGVTTESSFWHQLQRGQEGGGASRCKKKTTHRPEGTQ